MMLKHYSPIRSHTIKMIMLPVLLIVTVMFCTRQPNYPMKMTGNNDVLYSNVDLYVNPPRSNELNIERRGMGIRYDAEGNPFTGTQEMRFVKNDSLFNKVVYEDGIMISSVGYDKNGNSLDKYEYGYIGNQYKMVRHTKPSGVVVEEWVDATPEKMGYQKQWYENGQLKYEAYFTGNIQPEGLDIFKTQYQGLMTLYDEEGNVVEQHRYEDGEIVEVIK